MEIIEVKVTPSKVQNKLFSATLASIIFPTRSLNKIILDDSDRPNKIVQMNVLHAIYSVIVLYIIEVKVVYAI